MVSVKQIENGVASFLDMELMPNLPQNGIQKVMAGTAISLIIKRSGNIVREFTNNSFIKMLGIMDEEGNMDIDILRSELKANMPELGVTMDLPLIGTLTFHKQDVDTLYNHIVNKGGNGL